MQLVQGVDFPTTPGSYWVPVTAKTGYVLIGNSYLDISPASISLEVLPSNSTSAIVRFTNLGSTPLSVVLTRHWSNDGLVDLTLNTTSFTLASSGDAVTAYLLVNFTAYSDTPLQSYAGKIDVSTNTTETGDINLNVNVVGTQLPIGVSYIVIETFKNSSYSTQTTNFTLPSSVDITGAYWANATVTLDIKDPSGNSVSGYPTHFAANTSGGFVYTWNPAGATPGQYTAIANQSGISSTTYFNVTSCS